MSTLLESFRFLHPYWLWLLLGVAPLAWAVARHAPEVRVLARLADPGLLPYLLDGQPRASRSAAWSVALAATLAVLALAGPAWNRSTEPLFARRAAQVVAISMSPHMLARDVAPDRLARARYKVRALFAANADGLNGLVAYTGEAFTVTPLTTDAHSVDDLLSALAPDAMPVQGDSPGKAIEQAAALIRHANVGGGSIVVVTDRADAASQAVARRVAASGIHVSVLGIGTLRGGPITEGEGGFVKDDQGAIVMAQRNDASLGALASAGGGAFAVAADDGSDVAALTAGLHARGEARADDVATSSQWQDMGAWLLLPLLPLVGLGFRRGWLLLLALAILPVGPAHAASAVDAFRTRDQQAADALAHGNAKAAQALARDQRLRGAAAYRAGDYAAAEAALTTHADSDSQYNLGNALAKQQRYEDAIAAYDRALKANPGNADAAANRAAVQAFMAQRQKQDKKDDDGAKGQQDGKQGDQQPGKDQGGQGGQGKQDDQQKGQQGNQGAQGQSGQSGQDAQGKSGESGEGKGNDSGKEAGKDQGKGEAPKGNADAKTEAQRDDAAKAQQALKQKMDSALGGASSQGRPTNEDAHDLGNVPVEDGMGKLSPATRRQIMRVPDDPGALLRRKFMLEYQRRQGAIPEE
ncbi:tetratricopeptide repeat protein [Bacillus sp. NP157]|nr:tetratricopeptide repeat protein [Bacillus sp. NP157]